MSLSRRERKLLTYIQKRDFKSAKSLVEGNFMSAPLNIFQSFDHDDFYTVEKLTSEKRIKDMESALHWMAITQSRTNDKEADEASQKIKSEALGIHEHSTRFNPPNSFLEFAIYYRDMDFISYFVEQSLKYKSPSADSNTIKALSYLADELEESSRSHPFFKEAFVALTPKLATLSVPVKATDALIRSAVKHSYTNLYDQVLGFLSNAEDRLNKTSSLLIPPRSEEAQPSMVSRGNHRAHQIALQYMLLSPDRSFLPHLTQHHIPNLSSFGIRWDIVFGEHAPSDQWAWTQDLLASGARLKTSLPLPERISGHDSYSGAQDALTNFFDSIAKDYQKKPIEIRDPSSSRHSDKKTLAVYTPPHDKPLQSETREIFQALIQSPHFEVNDYLHENKTPLMLASGLLLHHDFALECAKLLLDRGASVSWTDVYGHTALYFAIEARNTDLTALLIQHGSTFDYHAAHSQNIEDLLTQDLKARDWILPILEKTLKETQDEAVIERIRKQLLRITPSNQRIPSTQSPQNTTSPQDSLPTNAPKDKDHPMAQNGDEEALMHEIKRSKESPPQSPSEMITDLESAGTRQFLESFQMNQMAPTSKNAYSIHAPIHPPGTARIEDALGRMISMAQESIQGYDDLLNSKLSKDTTLVRVQDEQMEMALARNFDILSDLIGDHLKVHPEHANGINAEGESMLHQAVRTGHLKTVQQLVQAGAKLDVQNKTGQTPLVLAADQYHVHQGTGVLELLLREGARVDLPQHANASRYLPPENYQEILKRTLRIDFDGKPEDLWSGLRDELAAFDLLDPLNETRMATLKGLSSYEIKEKITEVILAKQHFTHTGKIMGIQDLERLYIARQQGVLKQQAHQSPEAHEQALASFNRQSVRLENKFLSPSQDEPTLEVAVSELDQNLSSRRRLGNS